MSLTAEEQAARDALRARQGRGARYDAAEAPAEDLLLARRATSFFARKLNELSDAELLEGVGRSSEESRAFIVASVGYEARRMALALEPLCTVDDADRPEAQADSLPSLELAATLPARALRHLFEHSAIHLNVCWRDLPGERWRAAVVGVSGEQLGVSDLPRRRSLTLWRRALSLGNGASLRDVPVSLRQAISGAVGRGA